MEHVRRAEEEESVSAQAPGEDEPRTASRRSTDVPSAKQSSAPGPQVRSAVRDERRILVHAYARYVRCSPRKARLVCDLVRGLSVVEARAVLAHTPRRAAAAWAKLLESAVANAEHNHGYAAEELRIAMIAADEGPKRTRYQPRAMHRSTPIEKRLAHLSIALAPQAAV